MKIAYWQPQIDIEKAFRDRGHKTVGLDWHKGDWQKDFLENFGFRVQTYTSSQEIFPRDPHYLSPSTFIPKRLLVVGGK